MNRQLARLVQLLGLASLVISLSGCLTVEFKEYYIKLKNGQSGEATIRFINIVSESDDTTDITKDDFQTLIETYMNGNKFERDNPGFRNVKKRLYEEKGMLCGEITFTFDTLATVRLFKFDKDSPYMYYASNPLSSETLIETNGIVGEPWMPVVFWKKDAREFYVKTKVASDARFRTSLLKQYREWVAEQGKKK